jgi:hypothetical protein
MRTRRLIVASSAHGSVCHDKHVALDVSLAVKSLIRKSNSPVEIHIPFQGGINSFHPSA